MATESTIILRADHSFGSRISDAFDDFARSIRARRIWSTLAINDIAARYRGSLLGPLWITLTTAAFVGGVGILYSNIMHQGVSDYLPFLTVGVVMWNMISATINESCEAFVGGAGIIKQSNLPLSSFVWRVIYRNLINFAHQVIIVVVVFLIFNRIFKANYPLFAVGLVLTVINVGWISMLAALASTRFRDIPQVVASVLQIVFFISPVIWPPNSVGRAFAYLQFNPVYYIMEVTRAPLLGAVFHPSALGVLLGLAVVGWLTAFAVFASIRRRIVHFL